MRISLIIFATVLVFGCGDNSEASRQQDNTKSKPTQPQSTKDVTFPRGEMSVGEKKISVEIADTMERRSRGLMFRTSLPENEGMLFVFEQPDYLGFWMRNTKIPLSIAFIRADLTIANIAEMVPASDIDQSPPEYTSAGPCLYALEMNKEWFAKNGFKAGTKIKLPSTIVRR